MKIKPIILVAGEPGGVFLEILFKALKIKKYKSPLILICCKKLLFKQMKIFNFKKKINIFNFDEITNAKFSDKNLNIIDINLKTSNSNKYNKRFTRDYLKKSFDIAFRLIQNGLTIKFINGPINKKNFLNKKFLGITEFISNKFKTRNTGMLIYNKQLSVCPLTTHLPISKISKQITKKSIANKIDLIDKFYREQLKITPKIAVTGLNPHCESVLNFNEDEKIIPSVIKNKFKKGIHVKGPFPADTIFLKDNREKFNIILGMYHDQVLGPLKSIYEYDAINITMGLPFLRISPDHGPNKDMFGKNKSNPQSLIKALEFLDNR